MSAPTLAERIQIGIAGFVTALPPSVLRLLAGGRPIRIDGQELAPEVQLGLLLMRLGGNRGVDGQTPQSARADIARSTRFAQGPVLPVARIEPREIPGPSGGIPARFYVPANDGKRRALLVFYHGGGWVVPAISTRTTGSAASSRARPTSRCWRSTIGWRPSTSSRPRSTTRSRRSGGRRAQPAGSGAIPRASRSAATAPAARSPPSSRSMRRAPAARSRWCSS
jgi:hypothetical protein